MARILVVEDHEDTCLLLTALLQPLGYQLTMARTLKESLEWVRSCRYDLCLLDTCLPDGSAIELCREIRRRDSLVPIVFYSAAAQDSVKQQALEAGAQAYLVKPVLPSDVVKTLRSLLEVNPEPARRRAARNPGTLRA
jgi:DNA-binding response OmpR family regulator